MKSLMKFAQEKSTTSTTKIIPPKKMRMPGKPDRTESALSPDQQLPDPGMQGNTTSPVPAAFATAHKKVIPKVRAPGVQSK